MRKPMLPMRHTRRCQAAVYVFAAFAVVVPFLAGAVSMSAGCPDAFSIFLVLSLSVMGIVCIFKYGSAATALLWQAEVWNSILDARTQFTLPPTYTREAVRLRVGDCGESQVPCEESPLPMDLRYRFEQRKDGFACGTETVVMTYTAEVLDEATCDALLIGARRQAEALWGTTFSDCVQTEQYGAPYQQVCVAVVFAAEVEPSFAERLHAYLCEQTGDALYAAFVPCVIDEKRGVCVFDSLRAETGILLFKASKTSAIRLIHRLVTEGVRYTEDEVYRLPQAEDEALDASAVSVFRRFQRELKHQRHHREEAPFPEDRVLIGPRGYGVRYGTRCVWFSAMEQRWASVMLDEESKTALVDSAVARGGKYSRDRQLDRIAFIHSADSLRAFLGDRGYTVQAVPTE